MPNEKLEVKSEELKAYVESVLKGVSEGNTSGYTLTSGVKFHIGISNEVKKEGGVDVIIAHVGADKSNKENTTIEFEVSPKRTKLDLIPKS